MELCAACIYRNKKFCGRRCRLAPYFPASMYDDYTIVREFHGDYNILRILDKVVKEEDKKEAVQSLIATAKMRNKDPVLGIVAVEMQLRSEVEAARKKLEQAKKQLSDAQEGSDPS